MTEKKTNAIGLRSRLNDTYNMLGSLKTVCCRQCGCCRVACPQMKYSEALQIITAIWNEWSKEDKVELLITCVRYFFSKSLIKPCPLLLNDECRIYKDRPLNCRLYGLWPSDVWERRVESLAKRLDLPREQIPLNTQCSFVELEKEDCPECGGIGRHYWASDSEMIPDDQVCQKCSGEGKIKKNPLSENQIQQIFDALDALDRQVLSEGKKDKAAVRKAEMMIRSNWNYRTIHDWVLFFFWGEEKLAQMTDIAMVASKEQLDDLMKCFKDAVSSSDFTLDSIIPPEG